MLGFPPSLITLMRLQARALLRRAVRGARSGRGILFLAIGVFAFILWLGPSIMHAHLARAEDLTRIRLIFPLGLLAFCAINLVTTAGERAVAFSRAEVDFLFPGPFTRRQLLSYKLIKSTFAALLTSTLFSVFLLRHVRWWVAGWLGAFLSLVFLQLLSMSVVFIGQTVGERAYTRGRKLAVALIGIALAASLVPAVRAGNARSLIEVATKVRESTVGAALLAPFDVFGRVVGAATLWPEMLQQAGVAVLIILGMLALVFWLDTHYLEAAAATSQKMYDQVRRVRRIGGVAMRPTGSGKRRLPQLPRLGGIGPIAWRQLTAASRQSRAVIILMLIIGGVGGPILYFATRSEQSLDGGAGGNVGALIGVGFWMTFLFANALRFDFRGDIDQIDVLKALPISPTSIAAAQLVAPTAVLAMCQILLVAGVVIFLKLSPWILLAAIALAIPFNLFLFAIENLIFLLFPARLTGVGPGDFQNVGRQVVVLFVKIIFLLLGGGIAMAVGAVAHALLNESYIAFTLASAAVLMIEVFALLPLLVYSFKRFDPSTDTPPA